MSKHETVAVNFAGKFNRFVTPNQFGREVAGKVMSPRPGFRRECHKVRGEWSCFYRQMTDAEINGGLRS